MEYQYSAHEALLKPEFRFVKFIYTGFILFVAFYGVKNILASEHVFGSLLLLAGLANTLSPANFFNLMGNDSPLNLFLKIDQEKIHYKFSGFFPSKRISLDQIAKIGYAEDTMSITLKDGSLKIINANKIYSKEKKSELKKWVEQFRKKLQKG